MSLSLRHVTFSYPKTPVLNNISMDIAKGEMVGLIGASGCGKTTLLRCIAGLETITNGDIFVAGQAVGDQKEPLDIAFVFQQPALLPHLSVIENVCFAMKKADRNKAMKALKRCRIDGYADACVDDLSGGQQQRVAIARAIARDAALILLDEPFAHLDVVLRRELRMELSAMLMGLDVSVLLVTHDPEDALHLCTRNYVLEEGGIVQSGSAQELYDAPVNPFVAGFFGELNMFCAKDIKKHKLSTWLGCRLAKEEHMVMVRPEHVLYSKKKQDNAKMATVVDTVFLGSRSIVYVEVPFSKARIKLLVGSKTLPFVGDQLYLSVKHSLVF